MRGPRCADRKLGKTSMQSTIPVKDAVTLRSKVYDGDVEAIVRMHGEVYAEEYGFNEEFEQYVTGPLAAFSKSPTDRERLWIAERGGKIVGCIAIVTSEPSVAQLRWFLVRPEARRSGLGWRLMKEAITFSRRRKYKTIRLWTVSLLTAAAHLYTKVGFRLVEKIPGHKWGVDVVEERYEVQL